MSNQADHTIVRLRVPPELKKQIEDSADKNNRSQSAEMVARLEQSFKNEVKPSTQYIDISKALGLIFDEIQDLKKNQEK
ncbi:Arc family DNA-binding protein [Acinetobacter piscicola]|uniref:Arc family DNA-binding protein n=1 Tax=Acinetobacter piscicola TaxID=2006115 RepID=UPI00102103E9|nr:Arc family DNA-binding protein [Acinetobacter piscicola]RYL22177.1 Arc family DNA-binding protein [Acinetobacter piscicola]